MIKSYEAGLKSLNENLNSYKTKKGQLLSGEEAEIREQIIELVKSCYDIFKDEYKNQNLNGGDKSKILNPSINNGGHSLLINDNEKTGIIEKESLVVEK